MGVKQLRAVRLVLWLANTALIMGSSWSAPMAEVKMHNSDQSQGSGSTGESVTPSDKSSKTDPTETRQPPKSIHKPGTPVSSEELKRLNEEADRASSSSSSGGQSDKGGTTRRR
jgi:hypothetical protein